MTAPERATYDVIRVCYPPDRGAEVEGVQIPGDAVLQVRRYASVEGVWYTLDWQWGSTGFVSHTVGWLDDLNAVLTSLGIEPLDPEDA